MASVFQHCSLIINNRICSLFRDWFEYHKNTTSSQIYKNKVLSNLKAASNVTTIYIHSLILTCITGTLFFYINHIFVTSNYNNRIQWFVSSLIKINHINFWHEIIPTNQVSMNSINTQEQKKLQALKMVKEISLHIFSAIKVQDK